MSKPVAVDGRVECSHIPEGHVRYDHQAAAFRAELTCRCGRVRVSARRPRSSLTQAEADLEALTELAKAGAEE